ncbi:MAG TPA: FKBP-type peptidyl-prolyl cis-trans isomerase [Candidatus Saccharimonadales bacterium]|nr:FKBP-type peptidyl-prolyl cis-trans isomerase [Candidatus Saccharimonadales bacterium]
MAVSGKTVQRITIIIIALVMTVGTLGAYFIVIMQQNEQTASQNKQQYPSFPVDATAHKVEGKVNELKVTDLKVGEGDEVKLGDTIKVHYKGTFAQTGQKFESSYDRGEPVEFQLAEGLIAGWTEGLPGMKAGGKRLLEIPADKAYGSKGSDSIPPNTDLVFEVELISVTPKQ